MTGGRLRDWWASRRGRRIIVAGCLVLGACSAGDQLQGVACNRLVVSVDDEDGWNIYTLSDGTLTRLTKGANNLNPSWSPDGRRILFTSTRDGDHDLYTMAADGSDVDALTQNEEFDSSSDYSPDGSMIVFDRNVDDDGSTSDADPAQVFVGPAVPPLLGTQLTFGAANAKPRWSPDGSAIAFLSWRDGNAEVYVMAADGSAPTNLTNDPGLDALPAWSPDGSKIAFMSDRDGNREIYVMRADGSRQTRLTDDPAEDTNPGWSTDGRHILFRSERAEPGIYVLATAAEEPPRRVSAGFTHDCSD